MRPSTGTELWYEYRQLTSPNFMLFWRHSLIRILLKCDASARTFTTITFLISSNWSTLLLHSSDLIDLKFPLLPPLMNIPSSTWTNQNLTKICSQIKVISHNQLPFTDQKYTLTTRKTLALLKYHFPRLFINEILQFLWLSSIHLGTTCTIRPFTHFLRYLTIQYCLQSQSLLGPLFELGQLVREPAALGVSFPRHWAATLWASSSPLSFSPMNEKIFFSVHCRGSR